MSDNALEVRKIETDADMQAFLRFHWTCYKDEPNWVAPLWSEHKAFFDREENPELRHIDIDYFGAWRGETLVGIIAAFVNHAYNDFQEVNIGWFGSFEVLDDREAAQAMIKTAEGWCRARGVDAIHGPATFSTNSEIGLLIDGYDTPPMILNTHAHRYYRDFIESMGYQKEMDLWCYHFDGENWGGKRANRMPEKLVRVMEKLQKRRNFHIRPVNMRDFDNEVERVKKIYNSAWEKNWGFIPFSEEEINKIARDLKQMVDPNIAVFVEVDGEPIAFGLPLPNVYKPLRKAKAHPDTPEIITLLKLLWHWKVRGLNSVRVWALGVLEEWRGTGVDGLMYYEMMKRGLQRGYMDIEMSWILENNTMMNRAIEMLGGEVYKTYRVYAKPI